MRSHHRDIAIPILYVFLFSPIYSSLSLSYHLIAQIMFSVEHRSVYSLCNLLQSPGTYSLLGQNILPSTLFLNTLNLCSSTTLLFLLYINDLPQITNVNSKFVLFADDTSMITTNPDPLNFRVNLNKITHDTNEWFETNLLSLNLDKTHYIQFVTKNNSPNDFDIMHGSKK